MPTIFPDGIATTITQEEYDAMVVKVPDTADHIRNERNFRITQTDVWALSDRTMTAEQAAYRQALRDISDQSGFPTDITWPTKP